MHFFSYFPKVNYGFTDPGGNYRLTMVNPTVHVRVMESLKSSITVFYPYSIQDDERPDTVSTKLYGTPDYTWILLLINNIFSLFDWPLTNDELDKYVIERYGSIATAKTTWLYRDLAGHYMDLTTWTNLTPAERMVPQSVYDFELDVNDAKRNIRVVPVDFVGPMAKELQRVLNT